MAELVLALDVARASEALALLDRLPMLRWVKVGSILMTREGPALVRQLADRGLNVFLDLKWHDIPHTVAGAVAAARELGVAMATVHTLGGRAMLEAAAGAAAGSGLALVGVTVLTSFDASAYGESVGRSGVDLDSEVERLARTAQQAGLRGIVCSPREVSLLRRGLGPDAYIVVPGIRRRSDPAGDQVRVSSAEDTARNGATHLVVGRPVLEARNPAEVVEELMREARCVSF